MTLPFDPIDEAARQWGKRWDGVPAMHAVTSLMRVQQLVIGRLDAILKPHGLSFARYEALVLLTFSSRGLAAAGQDGGAAAGAPDLGHLDRAAARGGRAGRAQGAPRGRAGGARRDHRPAGASWSRSRPGTWSTPTSRSSALSDEDLETVSSVLDARSARRPGTSESMVSADDVRRVGLALPRTYEFFTGGRYKLKVRQIVYAAFSKDESDMGFGYPKDARDGLIESDPETFFLPPTSDLRYQWVCAHLDRLDPVEMRELVTDAWRMCTPKMLHDLPELRAAGGRRLGRDRRRRVGTTYGRCCTPTCTSPTARWRCAAATRVLEHLRSHPTPKPPAAVEVRDGQLYRWMR